MTTTLIMAGLLLPLLGLSAFFSGSETALFSLTRHQRAQLARSNQLSCQTLTSLLSHTRELLITLLLGNMTINVLYFVISSVVLIRLGEVHQVPGYLLAALTLAPLIAIILTGEVLPKLIAARRTMTWSRTVAIPLMLVHRTLFPLRWFCSIFVIGPLARLISPSAKPPALSHEELDSLLHHGKKRGVLDAGEQRVLEQVMLLGRLKVRHLQIPRVDMVGYDLEDPPEELMRLIRQHRLRHIPVWEGNRDHILGIVFSRQVLLKQPKSHEDIRGLLRSVRFVPEQQRADRLLVDLRKSGMTLAIVVNEYGGTSGLVTLEDVIEHLVGDIPGPNDEQQPEVVEIQPGQYRVSADLPIHEWADAFGRHAAIDRVREILAISTLGGFVMSRLGRVPVVGDEVSVAANVTMTVESMSGNRIVSLLVTLDQANASQAEEDSHG